jgi:hypothetical protein
MMTDNRFRAHPYKYSSGKVLPQYFEASSVYYALGLGASCAILNDMVSFSLGGKAVYADREMILRVQALPTVFQPTMNILLLDSPRSLV